MTAFSHKARVALIFFCVMALSAAIAIEVQPGTRVSARRRPTVHEQRRGGR
jgi:hypothetical protein